METWKDIPGFEGYYQVSDHGNVRSVDRVTKARSNSTRITRGRMSNHKIAESGHHSVSLSVDGKARWIYVHTLVHLCFKGPRPDGYVVHHIDENKDNNHIDNLASMKRSAHASLHTSGDRCFSRGERNSHNVLLEQQVLEIVELLNGSPLTQTEIAEKYDVSEKTINCINIGDSWNWLTGRRSILPHQRKSRRIKLSKTDIAAIREIAATGKRRVEIAADFGVSAAHIYRIAGKGN